MKSARTVATAILALLVITSPALARIISHSANITIYYGTYNLDLNGDGVADFVIGPGGYGSCSSPSSNYEGHGWLDVLAVSGNGVILGPLQAGNEIGPDQVFGGGGTLVQSLSKLECTWTGCKCVTAYWGPWCCGKSGYLGLSFQFDGQTHYGWARLHVVGITATLTGYAYETTPGMPIGAGETRYAKFTPSTLDLGTVTCGSTASGSVVLTNLSPTALTISSATLTGLNSADFASQNGNPPCGGSVAAGGTCTLTFSFKPSIVGIEKASYYVYNEGTYEKVPLTGTGQ